VGLCPKFGLIRVCGARFASGRRSGRLAPGRGMIDWERVVVSTVRHCVDRRGVAGLIRRYSPDTCPPKRTAHGRYGRAPNTCRRPSTSRTVNAWTAASRCIRSRHFPSRRSVGARLGSGSGGRKISPSSVSHPCWHKESPLPRRQRPPPRGSARPADRPRRAARDVVSRPLSRPGLRRRPSPLGPSRDHLLRDRLHQVVRPPHVALHHIPLLWFFHRVHHSIVDMDWMGNMRFHWPARLGFEGIDRLPMHFLGQQLVPLSALFRRGQDRNDTP
jgi:hypothetical protein